MLGVCYYPEHWPENVWADDAAAMAALGITYVRIGEFAWSLMEPRRDAFDWGWLDRAIETLAAAGLKVVLGTPTATPPKWLVDERPDILPSDEEGRVRRFGSRRHYCFSSPAWREETRRIVEAMGDRYGEHPAVAGWQIDNEYGCHLSVLSYTPHCLAAFRQWLQQRYGTIAALNDAWGTAFWSQTYNGFAEVDLPILTLAPANPSHLLDYRRFASDQVADYNRLQVGILRRLSPGRFLAHNFMGFFTEFDHYAVARDVDVASWDSYPLGHTDQRLPMPAEDKTRWARSGQPDVAAFHHDLCRGMGTARWWVMEQQPGPVNWADFNPAPAAGMVRLWTWEALAHGAEVVSYFRWRQAPFAQEQMHAGLNRPDGTLDQGGEEARQVSGEMTVLDGHHTKSRRAPVALLFDYEAVWTFQIQPQGRGFDYMALAHMFYRCIRRLGLDVDILPAGAPLEDYALVVAPSLPIVSEAAVTALKASSAAVVLGPRSGSKTASFQIPGGLPPGDLRALIDLQVSRVESLPPSVQDQLTWANKTYPVGLWRERLESKTAESVASFQDGEAAAMTQDRCHYLGFWPEEAFLTDYLAALAEENGLAIQRLDEALRLRRLGDLTFAFNYGDRPLPAPAPEGADYLLGGPEIAAHDLAVWKSR
ncbi:beta-galactosidase [Pelagibius litoralis]|uniref:Beta-galactosidase n=1 Tax=Pelagibius litoralis TaxID=374515 RepID=A0A967CB68_9PROT|nr:beta-galactosidase [Pelagibius litoralis]NIA67964.1 beta-galactosidase [Pelagibius litoralis]